MGRGYSARLLFVALASAMGGLLFGYDWVVIGGAKPFYEPFFGITDSAAMQGWAMSSALVGCIVGALIAGWVSDRYGRKRVLFISALLFIISAVGSGATDSFALFITYRIIGGFAIGLASNLSPMYIAEISPSHIRGRMVSLNQLTIVIGILLAQVVNMLIAEPVAADASQTDILESWNGQMGWRVMFWVECLPAMLFALLSLIIPESPRWLYMNGREKQAERIIASISGEDAAARECQELRVAMQSSSSKERAISLLHPSLRRVLIIGIVLAVFQQWCGINVIFNYAQEIFSEAGYGVSDTLMNIVITGVTNLIFTFVAISLVDKLGRRPLLVIGASSLALIYLIMGAAYYFQISGILLLIVVILAIACYAMSLAPVMWVVISEIFPNAVRAKAMSIATFALWSACFLLTYTFPILNSAMGAAGTFWLYGLISLLGAIFIVKFVPETKNRSLEEIEKELVKKEVK